MSRTDAHAPLWVRLARRELAAAALHTCHGGVCDLPAAPEADRDRTATGCRWEFFWTGTRICACGLCSAPDVRRAERRAERQQTKRALREAIDFWLD